MMVPGVKFDRLLPPFLIPAGAGDTDEHLPAALFGVVDVPVVPAARFKGDIEGRDLVQRQRSEIALADEVLSISNVRVADGQEQAVLRILFDGIEPALVVLAATAALLFGSVLFGPDFLRQAEDGPALRPAHIHGGMRDDGGDLLFGDAVRLCVLQVINERTVGDARRHQGHDGDDAFLLDADRLFIPYFSEQYVIVEVSEHRCELAELVSAGSLYDLFCHKYPSF